MTVVYRGRPMSEEAAQKYIQQEAEAIDRAGRDAPALAAAWAEREAKLLATIAELVAEIGTLTTAIDGLRDRTMSAALDSGAPTRPDA